MFCRLRVPNAPKWVMRRHLEIYFVICWSVGLFPIFDTSFAIRGSGPTPGDVLWLRERFGLLLSLSAGSDDFRVFSALRISAIPPYDGRNELEVNFTSKTMIQEKNQILYGRSVARRPPKSAKQGRVETYPRFPIRQRSFSQIQCCALHLDQYCFHPRRAHPLAGLNVRC
jgi:hypothetical protein